MKRGAIILIAATIILGGCGGEGPKAVSQTQVPQAATKPAEIKKEVNKDFTVKKPEILPALSELKGKNFYENIIITYPDKDKSAAAIAKGISADILKNKKQQAKVMKESDLSRDDIAGTNIMVIGNTVSSMLLKEMKDILPVVADGDGIKAGEKVYKGKDMGATFIYPNPYNTKFIMIVASGNSETALKNYNFYKNDIAIFRGLKDVIPVHFKEVSFGKYDEAWNIVYNDIDPKLLETGENDNLKVGKLEKYPFPEWARGKVIYEMFLRSFYDSDGNGKGDFKGVTEKLDYLKSLGVEIIWFTPIFDSPTYHGYTIRDYFKVNSEYGTLDDYRNMVLEIHKRGMKILLDMAFNHSSRSEPHFRDAYNNPDSKYDRWFYFANLQNTVFHDWYFTQDEKRREVLESDMPAWNTNNPEVIDFHVSVAKYWFDPNGDGDATDGVDGYRLDYVRGPSHDYWKIFRQKVKAIKPDAFLLAEAWVDADKMAAYFDNEFDAVLDFMMQGAMTVGVKDINNAVDMQEKQFPKDAQFARFMSNHDMDRFTNGRTVPELKVLSTFIYTINGMPTLYYGDEIGAKGDGADGDEGRRLPFEWYKAKKGPGMTKWTSLPSKKADGISVEEQDGKEGSLLEHYRKLGKIRSENLDIFEYGKRTDLKVFEDKNGKEVVASRTKGYIMENNGKMAIVLLNLAKAGKFKVEMTGLNIKGEYKDVLAGKVVLKADDAKIEVELDVNTAYIFMQ